MSCSSDLLVSSKKSNAMIYLFAISISVFGYLVYVLLKPERF
ncbi:MAG: potassium-transporting ATPase subunit F [Cytophagales bacterium]|nr:potassium-transporting ATPase subunit F [Cytophagales bacterium]